MTNPTLETIFARRSARDFTGEGITDEQLHTLLAAAMQAPSCQNRRKDCYLVIRDREDLNTIQAAQPYTKMLDKAACAILVCGEPFEGDAREYWSQDAAAAMENLLLAAQSIGLGGCWLGFYPIEFRVQKLREAFNIPPQVSVMGVAAIGVPRTLPAPIDRYTEEKVHYDRW